MVAAVLALWMRSNGWAEEKDGGRGSGGVNPVVTCLSAPGSPTFCAPEVRLFPPLPLQEDVRVGVPQDTGSATPSLPVVLG